MEFSPQTRIYEILHFDPVFTWLHTGLHIGDIKNVSLATRNEYIEIRNIKPLSIYGIG
jgi:hypothetical protein